MSVGLGVVAALVELVTDGVLGSSQAVKEAVSIAVVECSGLLNGRSSHVPGADVGVAVLGNLLVGLLGDTRDGTLDSLRDVVGGLLGGLHCDVLVGNSKVECKKVVCMKVV